jgi:hypothetical protein
MRACRIITTCFREGREWLNSYGKPIANTPNSPKEQLEFFKKQIEYCKRVDPGVETDIIIMLMTEDNTDTWHKWTTDKKSEAWVKSIDGDRCYSGIIKVIEAKNCPVGRAYHGYEIALRTIGNQYDYFLFSEDDVIIYQDNYLKNAIKEYNKEEEISFLSLGVVIDWLHNWEPHSAGGFGLTRKNKIPPSLGGKGKVINNYFDRNDEFIQDNANFPTMPTREIIWTQVFRSTGFIKETETSCIMPVNWKQVPLLMNTLHKGGQIPYRCLINTKPFIYQVGEDTDGRI